MPNLNLFIPNKPSNTPTYILCTCLFMYYQLSTLILPIPYIFTTYPPISYLPMYVLSTPNLFSYLSTYHEPLTYLGTYLLIGYQPPTYLSMMNLLSMKQGSLFCLSCLDLPNHGASCHILGIFKKLSMSRGASNWFETL